MHALDLGEVERAAGIADEDRARHFQGRSRLPAAGRHRASAGRDDLAALEQGLDARMIFVLLERLERLQTRILVVEADDVADVHAILVEVVEKASGVGVPVRRPAEPVLDAAGPYASWRQLPQLLVAEREGLRAVSAREIELRDELFGDRAARAFGQYRQRRVDLNAGGEIRAGRR